MVRGSSDELVQAFPKKMDQNKKRKRGEEGGSHMHVLPARPSLNTAACHHRTEILYNTDIAFIILMLEVKPGSVVLETGTGSGSLSTHFANAICPSLPLLLYVLFFFLY